MSVFFPARLVRSALIAGSSLSLAVSPAWAQSDDGEIESVSQPVVQPLPGGPGMQLNTALGKLARNPRDVSALIDAGKASAAIGDPEAAMGFFRRADQLQPGNANIKAGLAGAMVLAEDPFAAIPLFEQAERLGPIDPRLLSERGLAYDLVGDHELAQRYYREALTAGPDDETLRRLALSQAISGDRRGMELTLSPLLQKQDKAAWRTRAFAFAVLGLASEAEAVARANLPEAAAGGMVAYLRYMPRLTPAQQAAAANLGHFPRAAEIGRDDPRVAAFARPKAALAAADNTAPAAAQARVTRSRSRQIAAEPRPVAAPVRAEVRPAPTLPQPVRVAPPDSTPAATVAVAQASAATVPAAVPPAAAESQGPVAVPAASAQPVAAQPVPAPVVEQAPPAAPAPTPAPARTRRLADVFADLAPPSRVAEPIAGAVDLRRVPPQRPKVAEAPAKTDAKTDPKLDPKAGAKAAPKAEAKPGAKGKEAVKSPAASQPSRIWVQLAASRDKPGLAGDLRRFARAEPALLKGRKGYTSAWGQATRLLIGPFPSEKAASTLLGQLKKAGFTDSFVWTSPAGQVVDPLPATK